MAVFNCNEKGCNFKIELNSHCTVVRDNEVRYKKDRFTTSILCCEDHEGVPLTMVEEPFKGWGAPAKFANMTPTERSKVLDKRAKEHFRKFGKEEKHEQLKASGFSTD